MDTGQLRTRLRRIEGQTQGVQRMLEEDRSCEDVLTQLLAIRSAVAQVCVGMTERHLRDCVLGGEWGEDDPRMAQVSEALRLLVRSSG
jgi:DNA-binding FrmR family transcriptional regulator